MFDPTTFTAPHAELEERGIQDLQHELQRGAFSARELTQAYLDRITAMNTTGPELRAVIETNPDALEIAAARDRERASGAVSGPLHGIPILIKDNIDTADGMLTTAGSLALADSRPERDATMSDRLRAAGAVILGKANLSEWANFRSTNSASGWSGRGGQCVNPYQLDRTPSGSSSGSGVAAAANLATATLGSETDGSILSPSNVSGVVGIKPTVGLTSRAGVIPIAASQDTVGPQTRTVADAAIVLAAIAGRDERDPATLAGPVIDWDLGRLLDRDGLRGARIGVARNVYWGSSPVDAVAEQALQVLRDAGAELIDPADIPTAEEIAGGWPPAKDDPRLTVLLYEFKDGVNRYLAGRSGAVKTLADLIAFNNAHAAEEMPFFGQELFELAEACGPLSDKAYLDALARNQRVSREAGIDAVLREHRLDALVMPTGGPAGKIDYAGGGGGGRHSPSTPAALAGYPAITVPMGFVYGLPVGLCFLGTAWSEPTLIRLAYAYEQASQARKPPAYTLPAVLPPSRERIAW